MSKMPTQPAFLGRPFADQGDTRTLLETTSESGRASLSAGFPFETQLPLTQGGVAPNRTDFNAAFKLLSAFAFWQQSGGLFTFSDRVNYPTPSVIFHNDALWWCGKPNGPDTADGVKVPGEDGSDDYWMDFLRRIAGGGAGSVLGVPVGTVITYAAATAPEGFLPCDGSAFSVTDYPQLYAVLGESRTPDMRGLFVRGYDPEGINDTNGKGRAICAMQNDAIRNITGYFGTAILYAYQQGYGAFYTARTGSSGRGGGDGDLQCLL